MRDFLFGMTLFAIGMIGGMIVGIKGVWPDGMNNCRAANPGYDCSIGWVKSEPFGRDLP